MDSFLDVNQEKFIITFEILYSIGAGFLIYLSYIYITQNLIGCFVVVMISFGLKRMISLCLIMISYLEAITFLLWGLEIILLGFVFGLQQLDESSALLQAFSFNSSLKLIITFLTQFITTFCFQLLSDSELDDNTKVIQYVLFYYFLICSSISITLILDSNFKQKLKSFLNILSLYLSVSCLCLFQGPKGFNIAYCQLIIMVIGNSILLFTYKKKTHEYMGLYIFMNTFNIEFEEFNHSIFQQFQYKNFIILRYLSQVIRFLLICYFGIDYLINNEDKDLFNKIKLIHIILSLTISLIFLYVHFSNFIQFSFKYQRYKVDTEIKAKHLAKNMKKRKFTQFIEIDLCIDNLSEDLTIYSLIAQNSVDLFLKISEIKMKSKKQIKFKIIVGYWFGRYFISNQETIVEMLKTIEYAKRKIIINLVDSNYLFDIILERIQNGLIQNKLTSYLISQIQSGSQISVIQKLKIQVLVITFFYKQISQFQHFSPKQILYDLYSN